LRNADGSKNESYCSLCYENSAFLAPDFSVEEMQQFCIEALKKERPSQIPRLVTEARFARVRPLEGLVVRRARLFFGVISSENKLTDCLYFQFLKR
jgi:hypothetical protein